MKTLENNLQLRTTGSTFPPNIRIIFNTEISVGRALSHIPCARILASPKARWPKIRRHALMLQYCIYQVNTILEVSRRVALLSPKI